MKTLLLLKRIDFWLLLCSIFLPILYMCGTQQIFFLIVYCLFYICYVILGCQAISCIVNRIFVPKKFRRKGRTVFEIIIGLLIVLCLCAATSTAGFALYPYTLLLIFIEPGLAAVYVALVASEISAIKISFLIEEDINKYSNHYF